MGRVGDLRVHGSHPHVACFDEDRFESYRALGYHSIMAVVGELEQADAWHLRAAVAQKASAETSFALR